MGERARKSKIEWHRIPRETIVAEVVQLVAGVATLALGWVTLPLLYAMTGLEIVFVVAVSGLVYRMRSAARIVIDALKSLFLWLFCGIFVIAAYAAGSGYAGAGGLADGVRVEPIGLAGIAALIALRVGFTWLRARSAPDPRLAWTREAATRGATLALSCFFAAFACFIPGVPIAVALAFVAPDVAVDVALGFCLLAAQGFLALVVATMTPQELAEISRQPYLDGH